MNASIEKKGLKKKKMEQMHCKISSKKHEKYIKNRIVNPFLNCLESASFQLLKKAERKKQKLLLPL